MLQIVIYLGLLRWACDGELLHLVRDSFHYPTSVGVSLVTAADHGIRMHSRFWHRQTLPVAKRRAFIPRIDPGLVLTGNCPAAFGRSWPAFGMAQPRIIQ
jgi:hypothetical protein